MWPCLSSALLHNIKLLMDTWHRGYCWTNIAAGLPPLGSSMLWYQHGILVSTHQALWKKYVYVVDSERTFYGYRSNYYLNYFHIIFLSAPLPSVWYSFILGNFIQPLSIVNTFCAQNKAGQYFPPSNSSISSKAVTSTGFMLGRSSTVDIWCEGEAAWFSPLEEFKIIILCSLFLCYNCQAKLSIIRGWLM